MTKSKPQTASFMVRFTQNIYSDDQGTSNVQWRGRISHVQGGDKKSFVDFQEVIVFIQDKLSQLTKESIEDKSPEEQDGILLKSLEFWKKWSSEAPKIVLETIKDPKKQVSHLQEQLTQVGDEIGSKIEDAWRADKGDIKVINQTLTQITDQLSQLSDKVNMLANKVNK